MREHATSGLPARQSPPLTRSCAEVLAERIRQQLDVRTSLARDGDQHDAWVVLVGNTPISAATQADSDGSRVIPLRHRIAQRCAELGISQRVMLKNARLAHDLLQHVPARGHRIDTLERIAAALQWTLPELLGNPGNQVTAPEHEVSVAILETRWKPNRRRDAVIRQRYAAGASMRKIAVDYRLSTQRIHQIIRQIRKTRPPRLRPDPHSERNQEIVRRRMRGETLREIAADYGLSAVAIHKIVRRCGGGGR